MSQDQPGQPYNHHFARSCTALSETELLALILEGTTAAAGLQTARRVLAHCGGLAALQNLTEDDLEQLGIPAAAAARLLGAVELARRLARVPPSPSPHIRNAADAAHLLEDMAALHQEHVRIILLDSSRYVSAIHTVYIGTLHASVLRTAEVYREAIIHNSPALILAHNHPSGDPSPSPEDVEITRALQAAGRLLDIALVDHLIIARQGWRSLHEMGLLGD